MVRRLISYKEPKVNLDSNNGYLRLRWSVAGKRYCLGLNSRDCKTNRLKAQQLILQIEADIETNQFDPSLARYKPHKATGKRLNELTCVELYQDWLEVKSKLTDKRNVEWLKGTLKSLHQYLPNKVASTVTKRDVQNFTMKLREQKLNPETSRRKLENLSACYEWAIENSYLSENPWKGSNKQIKPLRKQLPKPFTAEEINQIIEGFSTHPNHSQLTPFVKFLFATGCRTSEAIGLRWCDLADDCSYCTISEQLTKGVRKTTKTGKVRTLHLTTSTKEMLVQMKSTNAVPTDLIFQWNGKPIDNHNFRERVWKLLLEQAGVPYRTVYNTRHTFISHALEKGINPVTISQMTGHDVSVLFNHYAGSLHNKLTLPELV